jgi:hypothetical protein
VSEATRGILGADDIEAAATAYYRERVAPAMMKLDEIVEDLGARAALRRSRAGVVSSLGIGAAGFLSYSELIAAALVPIGSPAGRELEPPRELQVKNRRHGYFFMWQVDRHLQNRSR